MFTGGNSCPTRQCVEPPVYGDFSKKKKKSRGSRGHHHHHHHHHAPSQKLHNTPRSDRSTDDRPHSYDCRQDCSWSQKYPFGTRICFERNSGFRDADVPRQVHECRRTREKGKRDACDLKRTPSVELWAPPGYTSRNTIPRDKTKMHHNVMWDPKVCRGSPTIHYATHQREKCDRLLDLNNWLDFKSALKARVRRRHERGGGYLDKKSNPIGKIVYPAVHVKKEPLNYESFARFLVEDPDGTGYADKAQCMGREENIDEDWKYPKGVKVYEGKAVHSQTEVEPCKRAAEDWIVDALVQKIPQQAVLECTEESDLELLKGQRRRYEMVFLFRKWQQMKEQQWNEWLYAWNAIRMNAIIEENRDLEEKMERVQAIGFAHHAISACFGETARLLTIDGFINEHGIPFEEVEEVHRIMEIDHSAHRKLHTSDKMSEKIIASIVTQSVVQRFASHMHDVFGKPHGKWLLRRARRESVDYDVELQKYLEGRWFQRREGPVGSEMIHMVKTDFGLGEQFIKEDEEDRRDSELVQRMYNVYDLTKYRKDLQAEPPEPLPYLQNPPPSPNDSFVMRGEQKRTSSVNGITDDGFEDDFSVLYKRETERFLDEFGQGRESFRRKTLDNDGQV